MRMFIFRLVFVLHVTIFRIKWFLLKKDKFVCINYRNMQSFAIELFKVKENLSNTIMSGNFPTRVLKYSLSQKQIFSEILSVLQNLA